MTERLILGTAGHIDHGKTALVRALTGVDCDRLPEEKARGITIELGFAPLDLPSGRRLGIVDVPGHERLVRTMVAGANGIDLVLFVVAADEGIMPQSREHLAICELLGVDRGVVALTKLDAVAPDLVELACLEIEEELAGSSLAGAPIVPVSAQRGDGLDALLAALDEVAAEAPARTLRNGPAWLPVDRAFTMRGFGTVVTGTLRGAALHAGEAVEVLPEGSQQKLRTKIRGLQIYGSESSRALPGSRCAVNLHGIELGAVPRGSVVATPERLDYRTRIDVELRLLPGAPALRTGTTLTAHIGTSERTARLTLLEYERLEPGQRCFARLRFGRPMVAVEGDHLILRGFSRIPDAGWTVGGGRIIDAAPLPLRRTRAQRVADLRTMASGDRGAALTARIKQAKLRGLREAELLRDVRSLEGITAVRVGTDRWLDRDEFETLVRRCVRSVERHHHERSIDPWVGFASVASRLPSYVPEEAIRAALATATERGELESAKRGHRRPGHAAHVADPLLGKKVLERLKGAGLAPPNLDALARELDVDVRELRPLADHLAREGELVRVAAGLFFARGEVDDLRERLIRHLRKHGEIEPAAYKLLTGQTRKYTVPLMEFFDTAKLTRRQGNVRVLRGS